MGKYISIEINETVKVYVDDIISDISTDDLKAELKKRQVKPIYLITYQNSPDVIIDWFKNPFVHDYDKNMVLQKINKKY